MGREPTGRADCKRALYADSFEKLREGGWLAGHSRCHRRVHHNVVAGIATTAAAVSRTLRREGAKGGAGGIVMR
jgi:hypothetical protein